MEILIICKAIDNDGLVAGVKSAYKKSLKKRAEKNSDIKIVCSLEQWVDFKRKNGKPKFVFIQPELDWNDTSYFGYEIAFELLSGQSDGQFFDLRFISGLSYEILLNGVSVKHRCLIEAFTHYNVTTDKYKISIEEPSFSRVHFDLMTTLITNNISRLNLIQHEVQSIQAIIQEPGRPFNADLELTDIYKQLEELQMIDIVPVNELGGIKRGLQTLKTKEGCIEILEQLRQKIGIARYQLLSAFTSDINPSNKSKYRVVIIEDNVNWRRELSKIFSEYFLHVYPANEKEIIAFKTIDAKKIVSEHKDADIFILDLLYKDASGFWFHFNGLDLYDLVKRKHPYAAVRIVSNLPRDMVAELSDSIAYPIHFSHVFPKKDGYIGAKSVIQNRLLELNFECNTNEKAKASFKLIPNTGFFKWEGMRSTVHFIMSNERELYLAHRKEAMRLFELFMGRHLKKDTEGWNSGELMTQRMEFLYTKRYVENKLVALFTHRLILIYKALELDNHFVSSNDYQTNVLKEFTGMSNFDASYFFKTGFHTHGHTDEKGTQGFVIHLKNLFPEEYLFIEKLKREKHISDSDSKLIKFPDLQQWTRDLFSKTTVRKNWKMLGLDFIPCIDEEQMLAGPIRTDLTVKQLKAYLLALFENYDQPEVEDMIMETIGYDLGKNWLVPADIRVMIEDLCAI